MERMERVDLIRLRITSAIINSIMYKQYNSSYKESRILIR